MTSIVSEGTRQCTKCGVEKPLTEFNLHPLGKDGRNSQCRTCKAAYSSQYDQERHEERQEYMRQYQEGHRDERTAYHRQHRQEHPEVHTAANKRYQENHPEVHRAAVRRRRARELNAEGEYTTEEFTALCEYMGWQCTYCGYKLTPETAHADHMIPLSRGGSDYLDNITPACKSCNSKKHDKTTEEYLVYLEVHGARANS